MRDQAVITLRYKHTFDVLLEFLNQHDWRKKDIFLQEFQTYISDKVWSSDTMRWANKQEQDQNISETKSKRRDD